RPIEPAVQRLMERVDIRVDDRLENEAAIVDIALRDGRTPTDRVDIGKGDPTNPLSDAELFAKFEELAARALRPPAVSATLGLLLKMETLESAAPLFRELGRTVAD